MAYIFENKIKCIMCGANLTFDFDDNLLPTKCYCKKCNLSWNVSEHKDNQNWAVRHIRLLEQENAALKQQIVGLMQQNVDLATQFKDFKESLAKTLGVTL